MMRTRDRFVAPTAGKGLLLAAGIGLGAWLVARPGRLPYRGLWRRQLSARLGAEGANRVVSRADTLYAEIYPCRPRVHNPVMEYHLRYQILPALCMYLALCEVSSSPARALSDVEELIWAEIGPIYRVGLSFLHRARQPFPLWRRIVSAAISTLFPPAGWARCGLAQTPDSLSFDITRCIYRDTLALLCAPELTPLFCRMDDRLATLVPASIIWQRHGTLAAGASCCDFCWHL